MSEAIELVKKLTEQTKSCEDKFLDLKTLKFEAADGEMRLYDEFKSYFFKYDPEKPKDPIVTHAMKQFCKITGVPFSFFSKNAEKMKNQLIGNWLPGAKAEKAQVMAKLRKTGDYYTVRAFLPVEYTNISNVSLIDMAAQAVGNNFRIEFETGDVRDALILHVRFISNDQFDAFGESCFTGFSIMASELGACPLSVETMLYRGLSKASFIASYGGESFFNSEYKGIQPNDVKSLFPKLIDHLKGRLGDIKNMIQSAKELDVNKENIRELTRDLKLRKGLGDKFHMLLAQELDTQKVTNRWDFANRIAIVAKEFDIVKRIKIEKLAGELIGLAFEKA